jgi:hypothetical protein
VFVRFRSLATFFAVVVLAGCGGASSPPSGAAGTGYVRFLNGSPDQPAVDFDLPAGTRYVPDLNYKSLTAYRAISANTYTVAPTKVNSINALTYTVDGVPYSTGNNAFTVAANHRYSVVLGGSVTNEDLTLCIFDEGLFSTASTAAAVQFNNCSPTNSSATGTITAGYYPINSPTAASAVSLATLADTTTSGVLALPASVASNGIGFYAVTPVAAGDTITPAEIDGSDTGNTLPYSTDQNASIFILDGPIGGNAISLVGAFDPDH